MVRALVLAGVLLFPSALFAAEVEFDFVVSTSIQDPVTGQSSRIEFARETVRFDPNDPASIATMQSQLEPLSRAAPYMPKFVRALAEAMEVDPSWTRTTGNFSGPDWSTWRNVD